MVSADASPTRLTHDGGGQFSGQWMVAYLAVVQDDGTDEPPSAAGHLAAAHQVLQLADLHCALEPGAQDRHTVSVSRDTTDAARAR